jgi:hypothetical protein
MRFKLRFPHSENEKWAAQYSYASDAAIEDVAPAARRQGYTQFLRGVSVDAGVSMRTLDRALWQYSKVKG